jgi:hypothetical protein
MTYEEAIDSVTQNPNETFIGIMFNEKDNYFGAYTISVLEDDPSEVNIQFEGSYLFSTDGEEDFYGIDDVPKEIESLYFKNSKNLPYISGLMSAYALYELFPTLPNPDDIGSKQDKLNFIKSIKEHITNFWHTD